MIAYWQDLGVDGFRCDFAHFVPNEAWTFLLGAARDRDPDAFFFAHRGGREAHGPLAEALKGYKPTDSSHAYWSDELPQAMLIDHVEAIWSAIAERDDWQPLDQKIAAIRRMGDALGKPPPPAGHRAG